MRNADLSETLVEILAEGISDSNDIDANYETLARGAARFLYERLTPSQHDQLIYWLEHPEKEE